MERARNFASFLLNYVLGTVFPKECFGCGRVDTYLCAACFAAIPLMESFVCPACSRPSFENAACASCRKAQALDGLICAAFYDAPVVRRIILAFKYRRIRDLAVPLAYLMLKALSRHPFSILYRSDLVLSSVPLSPRRERQRGFNQTDELARIISSHIRVPYVPCLKRTRHTASQAVLTRQDRLQNVRGAFACDPAAVKDKAVIVVDDVATTGSTLNAAAEALKHAGAREVWGLVAARESLGGREGR